MTTFVHISVLLVERVYSTSYAFAAYEGRDATDVQLDEVWMLVMMLATAIFMTWFGIESIVKANAFEIGAYVGTSAFLMVRQLSDYACYLQNSDADSQTLNCGTPGFSIPTVHTMFALTMLLNVVELVLCAIMVPDLRWTKYKAIGSDNTVRGLYKQYELFSSVRKMDLQFSVLLVITGLVFFSHKTQDQETGLAPTLLLALAELVWDRVGVHAIKRGDEWALYMFWALSLILPMYVSSVALVSLDNDNVYFDELRRGQDGSDRPDRLSKVAVLAIACFLNRISTVVVSYVLYREFGTEKYKALQRVFQLGFKKYGVQRLGGGQQGTELVAASSNERRYPANTINPVGGLSGATAADDNVSQTALDRLAAMYTMQDKSRSVSTGSAASFATELSQSDRPRAPSVLSAASSRAGGERSRAGTSQRGSVSFADDAERNKVTVESGIVRAAPSTDGALQQKGISARPAQHVDAKSADSDAAHAAHLKHRAFLQQIQSKLGDA